MRPSAPRPTSLAGLLLVAAVALGCGEAGTGREASLAAEGSAFGAVAGALELHEYRDGRILQRDLRHEARVPIRGRYVGEPRAIEARVVHAATAGGSAAVVVPWTVVDRAPANGRFRGALERVPQGGWYRLEVRFASDASIRLRGRSRFGVGVLVACAGQSHVALWFADDAPAGPEDVGYEPPRPHPLARRFRHDGFLDETWRTNDWRPLVGVGATVFANALVEALGVPVGLLPYGVGGSSLWQSNAAPPDPAVRGAPRSYGWWLADESGRYPLRDNYARLRGGLAAVGRSVEALLWVQGDTDALAGETAPRYAEGLATLFARVRDDARRADLPIFVSLLPRQVKAPWRSAVASDEAAQAIRDAQVWAVETGTDVHLAATTLDLPLSSDRIHHSRVGQALHAERMAAAVLAVLAGDDGEAGYRGPRIDGVTVAGESYLDVHLAHRGGSDFGPASGIRGFEVVGPGAGEVVGAWRRDAATVRLALGGEARAATEVCYLQGGNPGGLDPRRYAERFVHDDAPLALPLEAGCATIGRR